jgi:uncharacterized phage-associated protein
LHITYKVIIFADTKENKMKSNAIAIANYFIALAKEKNVEIRLLGLIKRVYITHGFCLAIFNRSALDNQIDVVEAWKLGPVIPSVYDSFKHFKSNPVTEEAVTLTDNNYDYMTVKLIDESIKAIADAVWIRYLNFTDSKLVDLLHRDGTPWSLCYKEGKNNNIPDLYTKVYYKKLLEYGRNQRNN